MPKQPDIRVVVGAERIASQSVIEQDLKRVAKDISGSNRIPHIAVGIDVNASRALFEKQLKAVAKGLKIEGIKLDSIQTAVQPTVNIDTHALVASVERVVGAVGSLQSAMKSTAQTPVISAERRKEIKQAADATILLQKNIAKAHQELLKLAGQQKLSYTSIKKYLSGLTESNASAFAWAESLNSAEEKYFNAYKKRIIQQKEYQDALAQSKNSEEIWASNYGSFYLNLAKGVKGNVRGFMKDIVPVTLPSQIHEVTESLESEVDVIKSSEPALRDHAVNIQRAIDAEAEKAAQSFKTANALEVEEDAFEEVSDASDKHTKRITVNATKNIKAFEREVAAKAKEYKRLEGFELESVSAKRDKNDNITGMRLTYNNPKTGAVYQAEYIAKTLDDAEGKAGNLNNEMIKLEQVSSRIVQHQRDLTAEVKKTTAFRDREANRLSKRADTLYLNSLDANAKKSVVTSERGEFESQIENIREQIAAIRKSSKSVDDLKQDINDVVRLLDQYETKMKSSQNAQYAATQLAAKGVDVSREVMRNNLEMLKNNFKNSGVTSEDFWRDVTALNADDIIDAQSFAKFRDQLEILKAQLKALKAEQKSLISDDKWLKNRLQAIQGINVGATAGKNKLLDTVNVDRYSEAYRRLEAEILDALKSSEKLTTAERAGIASRIAELRSLLRELQNLERVDVERIDLTGLQRQLAELRHNVTVEVNTSVKGFNEFKADVGALEEKYTSLSTAVDKYNDIKSSGGTDENLRKQAIEVDKLEREYRELLEVTIAQERYYKKEATSQEHRAKAFRDVQALMKKAQTFESMNDKFRIDPQLTAEWESIRRDIEAIASLKIDESFDPANIKKLSGQIDEFANKLRQQGKAGKSFFGQLQDQLAKLGVYLSGSAIWNALHQAMRQMLQNVIDLDKAMTELKKVTNETDATYERFLTNAAKRAGQLGATLADVVTATADFARLGYNIDQASALADAAIVYKNVGDGITDISVASESIISTMQAFGIAAEEVMTIVDRFNEVGK